MPGLRSRSFRWTCADTSDLLAAANLSCLVLDFAKLTTLIWLDSGPDRFVDLGADASDLLAAAFLYVPLLSEAVIAAVPKIRVPYGSIMSHFILVSPGYSDNQAL